MDFSTNQNIRIVFKIILFRKKKTVGQKPGLSFRPNKTDHLKIFFEIKKKLVSLHQSDPIETGNTAGCFEHLKGFDTM